MFLKNINLVFLSCIFMFTHAIDQAIVDELIEIVQEKGIECAEQEKPPPADIEAMMNKQPPSSHEGKCTIFCMMKQFNLMKDAVTMGPGYTAWLEKARANDPEFYNNLLTVYKICGAKVKETTDGCENAYALAVCSQEEGTKLGIVQAMGM